MKCLSCIPVAIFAAAGLPSLVLGQVYPSKPVRVVVPHPGGGGPVDAPARGLAEFLAKAFAQPFVVENRDGAQGVIGTEAVINSSADGYTLLFTSASVLGDPAYQQKYLIAVGVSEDEVTGVSPEKFAAFIRDDREAYEEVVTAAGIKKQ